MTRLSFCARSNLGRNKVRNYGDAPVFNLIDPRWFGFAACGRACPARGHCQTKFYTASWRSGAGWRPTVFAQESPTRSARFDAENDLYSFALTVPTAMGSI